MFGFGRNAQNNQAPAQGQNPPNQMQQPPQGQGQQGQQPQQVTPTGSNQFNQNPNAGQNPGQQNGGPSGNDPTKSPMEMFKGLWDDNGNQNTNDPNAPIFNVDQNKVSEFVRSQNFTQGIDTKLIQTALSGGEGAMEAFQQVLNQAVQTGVANAHLASAGLVQHGIQQARTGLNKQLPGMFKQFSSGEAVRAANPLMNNPAFKPVVDGIHERIVNQFPEASATEVAEMTNQYFTAMMKTADPNYGSQQANQGRQKAPDTDWAEWFENDLAQQMGEAPSGNRNPGWG